MERKFVTSTEFRNKAGQYFDEAAKGPVFIKKHDSATRVLIDLDEYERLNATETRREKLKRIAEEDHAQFAPLYEARLSDSRGCS